MLIRRAERADVPALLKIYNNEVEHSFATLDLTPKRLDEWERWFFRHNIDNHPLLVAEIDGVIAGYVSLSGFREKEGYSSSVELSIYVGEGFRRLGVASALMTEIIALARSDERIHSIVSILTDVNKASHRLHEKFGFSYCGRVREAGIKFGKYIDIDYYQLIV